MEPVPEPDRAQMTLLWYSPIYTWGIDPRARFPRERYRLVREGLEEAGRAGLIGFREPEGLAVEDLMLAHDPGYAQAFLAGSLDPQVVRRIGLQPWTGAMVSRTLILTGGTVHATRQVLSNGGVSGNIGGGTHHAYRDFGSGYCIFNDLAVAARVAQRDHGVGRVLILDLDVHQGDGTAAIFEDDPSVRTVSFHCGKNFPFRKTTSDLDLSLAPGTGDEDYLNLLERCLEREMNAFQPEFVFFQAGVDGLATDRLGFLDLTRRGLQRRNQLVFDFARQHGLPLVITMGGGYGDPIETSVRAHLDLFLQAAGHPLGCAPPRGA